MTKNVLGYLGANCTRLSLSGYGRHSTNVPDWLNVDSILTHLSLQFLPNNYQLWEGVCGKLTSLQTLYIREAYFGDVNVLSSRLVNILSRLSNLTELQLFRFAIKQLLQSPAPKFTALVNVRVFVLHLDRRFQKATNRERLTQFLVTNLLPNVQKLTIEEH